MSQIFESTRNYLKTSTKLGRRMSSYRDETSGSETSLHNNNNSLQDYKSAAIITESQPKDSTLSRQNSPKKRLSDLFSLDDRSKNNKLSQDQSNNDIKGRRRDSKSSDRTLRSKKSHQSNSGEILFDRHHGRDRDRDRDRASDHMEEEVPRAQSPTISMSNTISTATSSYDMRPTDYPSIGHYQAHVWRRNLLEESIMYSLRLGYTDRQHRSSSRQRHHYRRDSKRDSPRSRKAREQAILAAATGKEISSLPLSTIEDDDTASQENIVDRSLKVINDDNRIQPSTVTGQQQYLHPQFRHVKNSPYQLDYNFSMTNITQSMASFTLEVDDHHAARIMRSSAIPDLFKIKATIPGTMPTTERSRSRHNSKTSLLGSGVSPSPRVLTGKKAPVTVQPIHIVLPNMQDVDEEEENVESPLTPSSAAWADSVFESLDQVAGKQAEGMTKNQLKALEVAPAASV
ncbi:hypothetical protein BX616_010027 [Lobosporangium transversale]|uniref:Uncharacterized protein n=1 Tax=Lobosporangium transversale TaxID=64571 RepID=A0A1Y2GR73_9FUNG|nr:hypothetical protein BCR41DRAFT_395010 [Lobosporangium transversale]KAF9913449.1 hypothetical protein BX616_010027 [Lobosporangium transversale]ORZ19982.1 hypothetical protein BCR41DRAFT_395010 [Lobosporangium transversale]|eukprot:XP_021882522.1 hypothetical protein BCR41DRAFT_395010 [Lobosporangium transversale]